MVIASVFTEAGRFAFGGFEPIQGVGRGRNVPKVGAVSGLIGARTVQ